MLILLSMNYLGQSRRLFHYVQKQVYFIDYVCFVLESRLAFLAALPFRSSLDEDVWWSADVCHVLFSRFRS